LTVADIFLSSYMVYKIIFEATKYKAQQNVGCTNSFGLFMIVHSLDFIFFRLFQYSESHYRYRDFRATLADIVEQECNAHVRAKLMQRLKFFSWTTFVIMTFIGTFWTPDYQACPRHLIARQKSYIQMSWAMCLFYIMVIWRRNTVPISAQDVEMPSSFRRSRVHYGIIHSRNSETNKGLSEAKVQLIKKQKRNHFEDLEAI